MPRLSRRPVHCGYFDCQLEACAVWRCTHHTPSFLVVMYVYFLVQGVKAILLSPQFCILELGEGILRDELSSS